MGVISAIAIAAALTLQPATPQNPVQSQAPVQDPAATGPVELEGLTITGRRLEDFISDFVGEVAEPNRRRNLARWESTVCVGVANLRGDLAQSIADRVSEVAADLGLETGAPGCTPNVLIVAAADGSALAASVVEASPRAFRMGGSGMDRGGAALRDFVSTPRPIRWWQMAMITDSETGKRAVAIRGECSGACAEPIDYAPTVSTFAGSRLRTQLVDSLVRSIVIIDIDDVAGLSSVQIADYIAMVTLAQINPDAETTTYASILNLFRDPEASPGLTDWDLAYLDGLYGAERNRISRNASNAEIIDAIARANHRLREAAEAAPVLQEQETPGT